MRAVAIHERRSAAARRGAVAALCLGLAWWPRVARAGEHVVQPGETLGAIAARHGCPIVEVLRANAATVRDPDVVRVGQRLVIPTCGQGGDRSARPGRRGAALVRDCRWRAGDMDTSRLGELAAARGFQPGPSFRALVVKTTLSQDGRRIVEQRVWDFDGRSTRAGGWNPASTVKLFSGIAALEFLHDKRLGPKTAVTFHYATGDRTFRVADLFEDAMHWSKNLPHNRLVQLAGFDFLNGPGGTLRRAGLEDSYMMRAYAAGDWAAEGHPKSLARSPAMTLKDGRRVVRVPERESTARYPCGGAACASVSDLAKLMCVMMLHEQLPAARRLRLGEARQGPLLEMLRKDLYRRRRGKPDPVWDILAAAFPPSDGYKLFRKAGYSGEWLSDDIYVYQRGSRTRWILALANHPGRHSLDAAARFLAEVVKSGEL